MSIRIVLAALLLLPTDLVAQTQEIEVAPQSTVVITLLWGDVQVIGDDGRTVRISDRSGRLAADPEIIAETGAPVWARVVGDELLVAQDTAGQGRFPASSIEVRVPRDNALRVQMMRGGEISVLGMRGDAEIVNHNGSVALSMVEGSLRVTAMNGAITGGLAAIGESTSFASLNGEIDLTLPADAAITARLRTSNGRLISEFPVEVRERGSNLGEGIEVMADINGGGVPLIATTRSGDITLRRGSMDRRP